MPRQVGGFVSLVNGALTYVRLVYPVISYLRHQTHSGLLLSLYCVSLRVDSNGSPVLAYFSLTNSSDHYVRGLCSDSAFGHTYDCAFPATPRRYLLAADVLAHR